MSADGEGEKKGAPKRLGNAVPSAVYRGKMQVHCQKFSVKC
jgi:hypothetical protein